MGSEWCHLCRSWVWRFGVGIGFSWDVEEGGRGGFLVVLDFSGLLDFSGEGLEISKVSVERGSGKMVLEFSGVVEFSGEGWEVSGVSAGRESGEEDGLYGRL